MTKDELIEELGKLAIRFSKGWHEGIKIDASDIMLFNQIAEALAKEKTLQALHSENERLGLYKDAYAQPKPQIKTTDPFESSRVGDYNRGWNDCLFASGIVKQPEQEPVAWWVTNPDGEIDWCDEPIQYKEQRPLEELIDGCGYAPLYTAPPQRTWVGLTDDEIDEWTPEIHTVIKAIEAKLKERNT